MCLLGKEVETATVGRASAWHLWELGGMRGRMRRVRGHSDDVNQEFAPHWLNLGGTIERLLPT